MTGPERGPELGVYVHVPFCRRRCDYCAFSTYTDRDHLAGRYVAACRTEIARAVESGELTAASSVFFGGGTPSRLPAEDLASVLEAVPRVGGCEVTVECNPEDASAERFLTYREAGVTRVSFGVQSLVPEVLGSLGRAHEPAEARRAAELAADAGFESWNVDLIFGAVAETDEDWAATLDGVLGQGELGWEVPPPHLSVYALTVEAGTPLARDRARHPDDDVQARRYRMADERLAAAGYRWEEISNWAQPGHGCRHNRLYWARGDYLGFGSAAHSHRAGRRWWNVRSPERYLAAVESGSSPVAGQEVLTGEQRRFEELVLSLRTPAGVPVVAFPAGARDDLEDLVEVRGGRAVLTVAGRLLANEVTARLVVTPRPRRAVVTRGEPGGGSEGSR